MSTPIVQTNLTRSEHEPSLEAPKDLGEASAEQQPLTAKAEEMRHSEQQRAQLACAEITAKDAIDAKIFTQAELNETNLLGSHRTYEKITRKIAEIQESLDNPTVETNDISLKEEQLQLQLEAIMIVVVLIKKKLNEFTQTLQKSLAMRSENPDELPALEEKLKAIYGMSGHLEALDKSTDAVLNTHQQKKISNELQNPEELETLLFELNSAAYTFLDMGDHKDRLMSRDGDQTKTLANWLRELRHHFEAFNFTIPYGDIQTYLSSAVREDATNAAHASTGKAFIFSKPTDNQSTASQQTGT